MINLSHTIDICLDESKKKLTRLGFDFSFAFFAAERIADFRLELCKMCIHYVIDDDNVGEYNDDDDIFFFFIF